MLSNAGSAARAFADWPGWVPVSAMAAVVAVLLAWLAWRQAKRSQVTADQALAEAQQSQAIADERYLRDIQPRPRIQHVRTWSSSAERMVHLTNPGGRANACLLVVRHGDAGSQFEETVYAGEGSVPADGSADILVRRRYTLPGGASVNGQAVILVARDVRDTWWDCNTGQPIRDLKAWWKQQFEVLQMPRMELEDSDDGVTVRIIGW